MAALSRGEGRTLDISGMTHEKIEKARGIQWPFRENAEHEKGDQRLYTDGKFQTANQKANLIPLPYIENNEVPCDKYPFWMNSGRVVEHFHTRTKTGKIGNLNKFSPTPYMEMNPDAARELGVAHQSYVRIVSRRGDAVVMVQLTQRVPRNMVFIPFHFHDCVNRVSLGLLDPHSRQPAFKQCSIRIEPIDQALAGQLNVERRDY
jgi:assimilatory nitrate reductase catalytic subunit